MKFNTFINGCICVLIIVLLYLTLSHKHENIPQPNIKIVSEIVHDTVYISKPIIKDSIIIRYAEIKVPQIDTITQYIDTVSIELPIVQKEYADTSYRAWVSGYMANLDSIHILQNTRTVTNTVTLQKTNRWGVGVQVGIGIMPNKIQPYVGIGVTYNIFSW